MVPLSKSKTIHQFLKKNGKPHLTNQRFYAKGKQSKDIKIEFKPGTFKGHRCENLPTHTYTNREELLEFYREMGIMRRTGNVADSLYKRREIRGFLHLYNGQEAVASGLESILTKKDQVVTAYREHAFIMTKRCGGTPKDVLSELLGKVTGTSRGKGGSMHMYNAESNFYGGNGIVGAQVPLGTGLAFTQKYLNTGNVSISYYGDGAANQGQLYEAFNMAYLWKLPAIYVCENNEYGMGTSVKRASATEQFYTRGDYVPGVYVDGMDVLAVRECGKYAVEWAKTNGPIIIEAKTYRYSGHSLSDPGTAYRNRDEVKQVRDTRDPIKRVRELILTHDLATEAELNKIDDEIVELVDEAVEFARSAPFPEPHELYTDVLATPTRVRGIEYSNSYIPN